MCEPNSEMRTRSGESVAQVRLAGFAMVPFSYSQCKHCVPSFDSVSSHVSLLSINVSPGKTQTLLLLKQLSIKRLKIISLIT